MVSNYVNDLTINTNGGTTDGTLTLNNNISLDHGGDTADLTFTSGGNIIIAADTTIETEIGNNADAGSINFGSSIISANTTGVDLALNAGSTNDTAGNVTIGLVNNAAGSYLQSLSIDTQGTTTGVINLSNNITVDDDGAGNEGFVTIAGDVRLGASITIDSEFGNSGTADGGAITLQNATVSATTGGVDLTLDSSNTNTNGGNVTLGLFNSSGGNFINDLSVDTSAATTAGTISLNNNISLDHSGDTADVTFTGGGNVIVSGTSITIDTDNLDDAVGGAINLGAGNVSADATDF